MTTAQRAGARQTNAQRRDGGFFILAAVILLAFALRLLRLDGVALRGDEAFTIQYWPVGWNAALDLVGTDPHPWGAYALFGLWRGVFGDGVWIMRLLPALLSLPGVVGTYGLARSLFGSRCAGRIAALLYAVHPFLIWHA
ncbi:MAG: glycosyltransferase family 39 protein, partial [Anaerolineae bacterium]|nr:glycosyltransferase family 39 protein [Anaerolineae bacterium]